MDNGQKTQFIVEVVKQGEGAAQARTELEKLNSTKEKSVNMAGQLSRAYQFLAGSVIAGVLLRELKASIKAFSEQEIEVAKLNGTLRASGQFTEEYSRELQQLSSALQQVTRFGDETILGVERMLITFGAARKDVPALTELVLDLAEGMGTDLNAAALLVGKALTGEFSTLSRYGIKVNEAATANEKLNSALRQIEDRFGGLARGAANTATGQITAMMNAISDLREEIGALILQDGGPLLSFVELLTQRFRDWQVIVQTIREEGLFSGAFGANMLNADQDREAGGRNRLGDVESKASADEAAKRVLALNTANQQIIERSLSLEQQKTLLIARQELSYASLELDLNTINATEEQRVEALNTQLRAMELQRDEIQNMIALEEHRKFLTSDIGKISMFAVESFSSGFARAFVDFASGTKEAKEAFRDFAGNFLANLGEMIIQMMVFRALSSIFGLTGPSSVSGSVGGVAGAQGMLVRAMASGGLQPSGVPGAFMTTGPTHFPKFNALAGEAGPEVLTVLRAPKMLQLGGMLAASGYVGNTPLSLVNTNQLRNKFADGGVAGSLPGEFSGLASGGQSGGNLDIVIHLSRGLEGEIVAKSVAGARVRIAQDMNEDSDVSRATKRLVS